MTENALRDGLTGESAAPAAAAAPVEEPLRENEALSKEWAQQMGVELSSYERHALGGFVAAMEPGAFRLVLMNLVSGALRAASRVESRKAAVAVKAFGEEDKLRIEIQAPWGGRGAPESETRNPVVQDPNPDPFANRVIRQMIQHAGGEIRELGNLMVIEIPRFVETR